MPDGYSRTILRLWNDLTTRVPCLFANVEPKLIDAENLLKIFELSQGYNDFSIVDANEKLYGSVFFFSHSPGHIGVKFLVQNSSKYTYV